MSTWRESYAELAERNGQLTAEMLEMWKYTMRARELLVDARLERSPAPGRTSPRDLARAEQLEDEALAILQRLCVDSWLTR